MIIIEGIDGSGKTTLAKQMNKILKLPIVHWSKPPKTENDFKHNCEISKKYFTKLVIQDRTPFISEPIYGLFRKKGSFIKWNESKQYLNKIHPIIIYCRPSKFHVNFSDHDSIKYNNSTHSELITKHWKFLLALYDVYMDELNIMKYDWTNLNKSNRQNIIMTCKTLLETKLVDS